MMADSYRKMVADGKMTQEQATPDIRIYDFLATCTEDDFCRMVDSGAFNDIIRAYATRAIENGGVFGLFDMNADEVLGKH